MACDKGTAFSAFKPERDTSNGTNIPPPPVPAAAANADAKKIMKVQKPSYGSVNARSHAFCSILLHRPFPNFAPTHRCNDGHSLSWMQRLQMPCRQTRFRPHCATMLFAGSQAAPRRPCSS